MIAGLLPALLFLVPPGQPAGAAVTANPGPDIVIETGHEARLDGSRSTGPGRLSYRWKAATGPDISETTTAFEAPVNWADEYGTRMRGWLHPQANGEYTFWIASDDGGELWLSDGPAPEGKRLVASVTEWTGAGEWDKYPSQKSAPVRLKAGGAYYIEALQKEGRGWDSLAVAWVAPNGPREVVPGRFLSDMASGPRGRRGRITREVWLGIPGGGVADLVRNPRFTGAPVALAGATTPRPLFAPSSPGTYTFELKVSSGARSATARAKVRCIMDDRPATITVDTLKVRAPVNPRCLGINVNYLVDDESRRTNPVRTLAEALKEMGVRVLRYPGGDKSDSMLWSRPPYDRADPAIAVSGDWDWPATDRHLFMEDRKTWRIKSMDFDSYMKLAASVGAESTLVTCLDAGFRTPSEHHEAVPMEELVRNAVEWVKYTKRKGFPVRCWEIGNESYFEAGAVAYADAVKRFAKAMKEADPDCRIGATGLYGDSVGGKDREADIPWNKALMEKAGKWLDYVIVHDYPNYGWKGYSGYLDRDPDFTAGIRNTREMLAKWAPEEARDRIKVALTEYGTIDYAKEETWANVADLGHSLVLVNMIGQYLSEPVLDFATMWNTRWVGNEREPRDVHDALAPDNRLTPTGMALAVWAKCLGTRMLEVGDSRLLKVFAMHTPETGALSVFLLNKGLSPHEVTLEVANGTRNAGERWLYSGTGPGDLAPRFEKAGVVELKDGKATLVLPPVSLTIAGF